MRKATAEIAKHAGKILLPALCVLSGCFICVRPLEAQTRLAVLQAEDHRAKTASELATIRAGARSSDPQIRRMALRALGRLERPVLIPDILPALRNPLPETRAEAANAVGQAAAGWKTPRPAGDERAFAAAVAALTSRLQVETEADVRSAIDETIGRLPYASASAVEAAERTLIDAAGRRDSVADRLGVVKGFEALVRLNLKTRPPGADAVALLTRLAGAAPGEATTGARVRRLALEALSSAHAAGDDLLAAAARDPDAQVRRLAVREAAGSPATPPNEPRAAIVAAASTDTSPMVRIEAMRVAGCGAAVTATTDADAHVMVAAYDRLARCGESADAVAALERATEDPAGAAARSWHSAAHAIVALATAAPERAGPELPHFTASKIWQLRVYAARAASLLKDRAALETLAEDDDDNVREAALEGLRRSVAHDADSIYLGQLERSGNQILRAAAAALDGTPHPETAAPALMKAWSRLAAAGLDNSHDARSAIAKTLASIGQPAAPSKPPTAQQTRSGDLDAQELKRLASPRARVTIRDVGTFDLALFTAEAPATVLRFAKLAESGYYNGLTFHRVVANFVIQGGSPGANEYIGDSPFMRDEVGLWPHVRGAVGISTRGRDTGDAQIFIDLVDNPRLDHAYTVFAQVLNGIDVVDRILEGDVIERIEIVP